MKKILTVFTLILIQTVAFSQVPNGGFEQWTEGNPNDWVSSNIQGFVIPITQSTDANSGSSALRGEVLTFFTGLLSPFIQSGLEGEGFPVSVKYSNMTGFFKFAPVEGDRLSFVVIMYEGTLDSAIGGGAVAMSNAMSSYTQVNVPIAYFAPGEPDICIINVSVIGPVTGDDYHLGSVFFADDISLSGEATGLDDPSVPLAFKLEQNYPNPFNPSTKIKYTIPEASNVEFSVYNLLGKEVYSEEYFKQSGSHEINFNSAELSSGVYFYTVKAGEFSSTRKFMIMK